MTKNHGPDAYIVFIRDGDSVATVGPFEEEADADSFVENEIAPHDNEGMKADIYPLSAPSGIFINYIKTRKQDD